MAMSSYFTHILLMPITWFVFLTGLIVGSFLNVCIYRVPRGIFWQNLFSRCCHCSKPIPIWYNIPILSYLILLGKTKCCKKSIPIQYVVVELLTALAYVFLFFNFFSGLYNWPIKDLELDLALRFVHAAIFISILIVCSFIDLSFFI